MRIALDALFSITLMFFGAKMFKKYWCIRLARRSPL